MFRRLLLACACVWLPALACNVLYDSGSLSSGAEEVDAAGAPAFDAGTTPSEEVDAADGEEEPGCARSRGCTVVADGLAGPTDLLLRNDGVRLLWLQSQAPVGVMEIVLSGQDAGAPVMRLATASAPTNLMAHGASVLFVSGGTLQRLLASNELSACFSQGSLGQILPFPNSDVNEFVFVSGTTSGLVRRRCANTARSLELEHISALAVERSTLPTAWIGDEAGVWRCTLSTTIASQCRETLSPLSLAEEDRSPSLVTGTPTSHVVWVAGGTVRSRAKVDVGAEAGSPITLATGQAQPKHLVGYAGQVFWTNVADGRVMRAPVDGSAPPTEVLSGLEQPWGLVVSATDVFVSEYGRGRILRVAR